MGDSGLQILYICCRNLKHPVVFNDLDMLDYSQPYFLLTAVGFCMVDICSGMIHLQHIHYKENVPI